jgi:hypothetical protein
MAKRFTSRKEIEAQSDGFAAGVRAAAAVADEIGYGYSGRGEYDDGGQTASNRISQNILKLLNKE